MAKSEPRFKRWASIRLAREDADDDIANLLREAGWKHTSSTPGCYWMWLKEWDGKTFMVDQNVAARIQSHWDAEEYAKAHPEKFGD